jgi:hypothetical protein
MFNANLTTNETIIRIEGCRRVAELDLDRSVQRSECMFLICFEGFNNCMSPFSGTSCDRTTL